MANLISFKYRNNDTEDPICGLTINYMVQTVAVLANTKKPAEGELPIQRGGVAFSESLLDGTVTTDSDGIIEVDVSNMFTDPTFLAYFQKFGNLKEYNVSLLITLMNEKQEIGPYVYLGTTQAPQELLAYNIYKVGPTTYRFNDLAYYDVYDSFYVPEVVINEELLRIYQSKKLKAQQEYLEKLKNFQGEIESQSILQIPTLTRYNPINITQVITRCLELNVGTIENALTFTKDAGLIGETNRLNGIKTLIEQISSLYPNVTIDQGEGLPYQNIGVIPMPFRGYSFFQENDNISFFATLMNNYRPVETATETELDVMKYNQYLPTLSLNSEVINQIRWDKMSEIKLNVETQGWGVFCFTFENINDLVTKWQKDNKLEPVGLVPGDVLSVTSYIASDNAVEKCGDPNGCVPTTPGIKGGQYITSLVIK